MPPELHGLLPGERGPLAPLFAGFSMMPATIAAAIAGGMGHAWADHPTAPRAAMLHLGAFAFFAGGAAGPAAEALIAAAPRGQFVYPTAAWRAAILRVRGPAARPLTRYHCAPGDFDRKALAARCAAGAAGCRVAPLSAAHRGAFAASGLHETLAENFGTLEAFFRIGFGFAAWDGPRIAAHASSYAVAPHAIEVQLDTDPAYRRRGLATLLGAHLVLECLERRLTPHWDAENAPSARIAARLGYRVGPAYEVLVV